MKHSAGVPVATTYTTLSTDPYSYSTLRAALIVTISDLKVESKATQFLYSEHRGSSVVTSRFWNIGWSYLDGLVSIASLRSTGLWVGLVLERHWRIRYGKFFCVARRTVGSAGKNTSAPNIEMLAVSPQIEALARLKSGNRHRALRERRTTNATR
jgi:hypothetical protein